MSTIAYNETMIKTRVTGTVTGHYSNSRRRTADVLVTVIVKHDGSDWLAQRTAYGAPEREVGPRR